MLAREAEVDDDHDDGDPGSADLLAGGRLDLILEDEGSHEHGDQSDKDGHGLNAQVHLIE